MIRVRLLPAAVALAWVAGAVAAAAGQSGAVSRPGPAVPAANWTRCVPGMAGAPVERVRRVASASAEMATIEPAIRRLFAPQEQALRLSSPNLADAPVTIIGVYASTGQRIPEYYFEASKGVRDEATEVPGEEGLLRVVVTGWLRGRGRSLVSLGTKGDMMWGELDRPGATEAKAELVPLGILRRGDSVVWALQRTAPAGGLRLYELGAAGVRRRDAAGVPGC